MTVQLPPQGPQEPDEHLPGETELVALYRQLPQSEPSAALDAAVLHAAAQAVAAGEQHPAPVIERRRTSREPGDWVHPKPASAKGPDLPGPSTASPGRRKAGTRWLIALSSAATLVLAAGLAWHMRGMPSTEATPEAAKRQTAVSSPADLGSPAAAATPLPPVQTPAAQAQAVVAQRAVQPTERASTARATQQAVRMASTAAAMKPRNTTPPPPVAEEVTEATAAAPLADAEVSSAGIPAAKNHSPAPVLSAAPAAGKTATAGISAASMPAAPAPPPMPAPIPMSAIAAAPMSAPAAPAVEKTTSANPGDTPALELDKIQQLFAQGHDDEARQRLTAFHDAHPQWTLPAELDAQLHKP